MQAATGGKNPSFQHASIEIPAWDVGSGNHRQALPSSVDVVVLHIDASQCGILAHHIQTRLHELRFEQIVVVKKNDEFALRNTKASIASPAMP